MERIGKRIGKRPQLFQKQSSRVLGCMRQCLIWLNGLRVAQSGLMMAPSPNSKQKALAYSPSSSKAGNCTIRSHDGTLTKFKTKGPGV